MSQDKMNFEKRDTEIFLLNDLYFLIERGDKIVSSQVQHAFLLFY